MHNKVSRNENKTVIFKKVKKMKKGIDITKINIKWDSEKIRLVTCLDLYQIVISLLKTCRTPPPLFFCNFSNRTCFQRSNVHVSNIF